MTSITVDQLAHPRIRQRREAVEGEQVRRRNRKLMLAGVLALVGLVGYAVTQSPLLDVDEVRIIGAGDTGANTLRAIAGIEQGTPLVDLDLAEAERRLRAVPAIESVSASKRWSGVVTFEVVERRAVAAFATANATITVAADGVVLEVAASSDDDGSSRDANADLPVITGAMFESGVGDIVPAELRDALAVATALPDDVGTVTDRVEISADGVALRLDGGGGVQLGDARHLEAKTAAVRAFMAQVDLTCLDTIDVRAPLVPVVRRVDGCR